MAKEKRLKDKAGRIFLKSKRLEGRKGFTEFEINAGGDEEFETVSAEPKKAKKKAAPKKAEPKAEPSAEKAALEGWEE